MGNPPMKPRPVHAEEGRQRPRTLPPELQRHPRLADGLQDTMVARGARTALHLGKVSPYTGNMGIDNRRRGSIPSLLVATVLSLACAGGDGGSETDNWQFNVDTIRSEAGGSVRQTAWLRAAGQESSEGAERPAVTILSFDCLPDQRSSTIMTDQALRQGSVETRLKLDTNPPLPIPGFAGTTASGGQVVLTIPQDSMLALLSGHKTATFEYADGAGSSQTTAVFPINGLEEYRGRFVSACGHRGDGDQR